MLESGFYNMDCMDAMREFPDNFFELAVVDPPYGDGGGLGQVKNDRTGGTWAAKFSKKLYRGTSRRNRNTSKSCSVSHRIRLYGGATTSNSRKTDVF